MIKKVSSLFFIIVIGLILFAATIRGDVGNMNDVAQLGQYTLPGGAFESSHERAPYAEMLAIKTRGTIELGEKLADFGSPDIGYDENKYYSFFPSGIPVILLAGHTIGSLYNHGQIGAYFMMSIATIITMIFIYLICRDIFKLDSWAAIAAPIVYAFGTSSWSYSVTIYQHAVTAMLAMIMFYLTWLYRKRGKYRVLWASLVWTLYGLSFFIDYPNALILMPNMVYFLLSSFRVKEYEVGQKVTFVFNGTIIATMIFFVMTIGYHGYHNTKFFGQWYIIANSLTRYTKDQGKVVEIVKQDKTEVKVTRSLIEELLPSGSKTLLFGIDKGLFLFSPVLIMALLGYLSLWNKRRTMELGVISALPVFNLFVYASFGDPYGGWAFGPRYLIPAMASLSIMTIIGLQFGRLRALRRLVFFILFMISSGIALVGALTSNLIPPKVEADYLKIDYYNFTHNFDLIYKNASSSYAYNAYVSQYMTLEQYAVVLWSALIAIMFVLIFLLPLKLRAK